MLLKIEVDHGTTPTAVTVDVDMTTYSSTGLVATIFDMTQRSGGLTPDSATDTSPLAGVAQPSLALPARTGKHYLVLSLSSFQIGVTDYIGNVTVSAGSIGLASIELSSAKYSGLKKPFNMYATFSSEILTQSNFSTTMSLDFGTTAQAITFKFDGAGAYSGSVQLRIEVEGTGTAGDVYWATWFPTSVSITGAFGDGVASSSSGGGGGGGGCIANGDSKLWMLMLAGFAGLVCLRRRSAVS
jgi:hypothetical protein